MIKDKPYFFEIKIASKHTLLHKYHNKYRMNSQTPGDFSFIKDTMSREMLEDGYTTISNLELWDWMKSYTPDEGKGFMFSSHENITKMGSAMKTGHSGSSFGWTMRSLESIAKNGWESFVESWKKE
jgi:hypothetical protein